MLIEHLYESSEQNIRLLKMLARMVRDSITNETIHTISDRIERYRSSTGSQVDHISLDNPFDQSSNYEQLRALLIDENIPKGEDILDGLLAIDFYYELKDYEFKDGDANSKAAATYSSAKNSVQFYSIDSLQNPEIIAHELRHAIQYFTYEATRKKTSKDKEYKYREIPIEIDAYWYGIITEYVLANELRLPYSDNTDGIVKFAKPIYTKFKKEMAGYLSSKNETHYWRKTVKAILAISLYHESGMSLEVKTIRDFLKQVEDKSTNELLSLLDNDASEEDIEKSINSNTVYMDSINGYDSSLEPSSSVYSSVVHKPSKVSTRISNEVNARALLYFAMIDNKEMASKFKDAIKRTIGVPINDIMYDFVDEHIENVDNQSAILIFIRHYYDSI